MQRGGGEIKRKNRARDLNIQRDKDRESLRKIDKEEQRDTEMTEKID